MRRKRKRRRRRRSRRRRRKRRRRRRMIGNFILINVCFVLHSLSSFSLFDFFFFFLNDEFARLINATAHTRNGNPPSQCLSTWRPMVIWSIRALALSAFHRGHCDPFINDWLTRISISRDSHEPRIWERSTHTKVVSFRDDLLSTLLSLCTILNSINRTYHSKME